MLENCPGTRVGNELLTFVHACESIRPIGDKIFLEPLPYEHLGELDVVYQGKPLRGRVLAVGSGCYPWKYFDSGGNPTQRRGDRKIAKRSKHFRPCDAKVGDIVELGGLEIGGYLFQQIRWGDKDVIICREEDVCVIREV
jgi:hypothetical protein